jgi:hypothetical protein
VRLGTPEDLPPNPPRGLEYPHSELNSSAGSGLDRRVARHNPKSAPCLSAEELLLPFDGRWTWSTFDSQVLEDLVDDDGIIEEGDDGTELRLDCTNTSRAMKFR